MKTPPHNIFRKFSQKGFGIAEGIVAAAIISTAALGAGAIVNQIMVMAKRSFTMNHAISLQSEIIAAIQDEKQFTNSSLLSQLRTAADQGAVQNIDGIELRSSTGEIIVRSGDKLGFDMDMNSCNPNLPDCLIRTEFGVQCGDHRGCRAAYRISFSEKYEDILRVPLGAASLGAFQSSDYFIPVRYDAISQADSETCDPANSDVFVTGVQRINGKVICARKAQSTCPAGTFPENLVVQDGRVEFTCRPLPTAQCPPDYVWQATNLAAYDPGTGGVLHGAPGHCVYRWRNNIPWQVAWPHGKHSVSGIFCNPEIYNAQPHGACQAVVIESRVGSCGAPSVSVQSSVSGSVVTCSIVKNEPCDAAIRAYVVWNGSCVIKVPETAAPL